MGIISDHMVLQHGVPVPLWGTSTSNRDIEVRFRGQVKTTKCDERGAWHIVLDPMEPGGPDDMLLFSNGAEIFQDVLVGEVWLGAGQSNMAGLFSGYVGSDPGLVERLREATYPKLRLFTSSTMATWREATAEALAQFSANLGVFGIALQAKLDMPVGLIVAAKGGTPSCFWLSKQMYDSSAECKAVLAEEPSARSKVWVEECRRYSFELDNASRQIPRRQAQIKEACAWGQSRGEIGHLYEEFVRRCIPYAIRGVLWDQGEAGSGVGGLDQYNLMGALIQGWRKDWNSPALPFFYFQKPSGGIAPFDPNDPLFARSVEFQPSLPALHRMFMPGEGFSREIYSNIARHPLTFMVPTADLSTGAHPPLKTMYGLRAFHRIGRAVYGCNDLPEGLGPYYHSHTVGEGHVVVDIANTGGGLVTRHVNAMRGFMVASANQAFVWANAEILRNSAEGTSVRVWHESVKEPVAVRYGWSWQPKWVNIYGENQLPLQPFRTDDWEV